MAKQFFRNAFPHGVAYATPKAIAKHGSPRQALNILQPTQAKKTKT